jgi:hypothetical protein
LKSNYFVARCAQQFGFRGDDPVLSAGLPIEVMRQ